MNNNSGKLVLALLTGAAIGATLGILLAPDKGSETRKKIIGGAKDFADNLKQKAKQRMEKFEEEFDDFKNDVKSKADNMRADANRVKTEATRNV
jgi:gas vesicle protein